MHDLADLRDSSLSPYSCGQQPTFSPYGRQIILPGLMCNVRQLQVPVTIAQGGNSLGTQI